MKAVETFPIRVVVKAGWDEAGRRGIASRSVFEAPMSNIQWRAVLWDDAEDPDFYKAEALQELYDDEEPQ